MCRDGHSACFTRPFTMWECSVLVYGTKATKVRGLPLGVIRVEVRAKRASKDGNTHGLATILRGPRKGAGTYG